MKFTLPYPPSTNDLYRSVVKGNRAFPIKTARYREYEGEVRRLFAEQRKEPYAAGQLVAVTVHVYRPQRSGDLDGRLKSLLDVLQGVAYVDDKQVIEIHAFRHDDKVNPRVTVEVWDVAEMPEADPGDLNWRPPESAVFTPPVPQVVVPKVANPVDESLAERFRRLAKPATYQPGTGEPPEAA